MGSCFLVVNPDLISLTHSDLVKELNNAAIMSCFYVLLLTILPVLSRRRTISSETFFSFKLAWVSSSVSVSIGITGTTSCEEILMTFLADSRLYFSSHHEA